ncbi:LysE family translocator [Pleurocapsa sp. CCALA 161]|uniref:LysE family translocator n=1 Tax=Pleurocapsa sp. CCALA 161 TaxID=2107688 RepID=UPI000D057B59|nr:LysE family translocator [Pleurocapsa sp. CCALA 161]PSB09018.1 LysE family translocator [Pleurocapsa sp. CCALA 161]
MFGTHNLSAFLLSSFLLWITPGTDTMYILARSISQGHQAGLISVLGVSSGILIHTTFAAFGLSALLATSAWAFTTIKIVGAVYLIYLGLQAWLKKSQPLSTLEINSMSSWQIYRQGVVTNVLNPKVAIFFLAFLPQFVEPTAGFGALPFLLLGILFVTGGTVWCLLLAGFAAMATNTLREKKQVSGWLERITGCVYIGLGLNLLRSKSQPT